LFHSSMHLLEDRIYFMGQRVKTVNNCSARDWDRIRITWGNPQSGCSDICSYSKRATVGVRAPMWPGETPVWSESSVDERNLYFARSTIIGLVVETWRVKTELIIITILHIIIITAPILNLGFKTIAPKILAHTTCINRYWNTYKY